MIAVSFTTVKADLETNNMETTDADAVQPAPFLSRLKRKVSLDLSLVEPRHVRLRSTQDDHGGNEDGEDDEEHIIIDIDPEPIFRPIKQV